MNFFKNIFLSTIILLFIGCSNNSTNNNSNDPLTTQDLPKATVSINNTDFEFILAPCLNDSLWVSKTEITEKQYSILPDYSNNSETPKACSWYDAVFFANHLSKKFNGLNSGFDTAYTPSNPETLNITLPVIHYGPLVCLSKNIIVQNIDSLPTDTTFLDSVYIITTQLCSITYSNSLDSITKKNIVNTFLDMGTDSIVYNSNQKHIEIFNTKDAIFDLLENELNSTSSFNITCFSHSYTRDSILTDSSDIIYLRDSINIPVIDSTTGAFFTSCSLYNKDNTFFITSPVKITDTTKTDLYVIVFNINPSKDSLSLWLENTYKYPDSVIIPAHTYRIRQFDKTNLYGFRLPTENEWEDIAECNNAVEYSTFSGNLSEEGAVYNTDTVKNAASKRANPWGFYDFTGNLYEWTDDWYSENRVQTPLPETPAKVIKGGCFKDTSGSELLKIEGRYSEHPDSTYNNKIGFRLVIQDTAFWNDLRN